jgi:hypothetical protein
MTQDQKAVAVGMGTGLVTMIVATGGIYQLWPVNPDLSDVTRRLAFAVQANAFASVPLLLAIAAVANGRFGSEAIDPMARKESTALLINGRVVDNTLQQFVLFAVAAMAISVNASASEMRLLPAAAIVFVVARAVFWIGYRVHPLYRAPGMAATMYLNIVLLVFALYKAATAG